VTYVRCRDCGASVPADARWCSLCFADQREPTAVTAADPVVATHVAVPDDAESLLVGASDALSMPIDALLQPDAPLAPGSAPQAAASTSGEPQVAAEACWPCTKCDERVPMSLDACPTCGSSFLSGTGGAPSMQLPVVGDVGRLSRTQRLLFGLVIAVGVMVVLVAGAAIVGHVF
jgi:hypothetical protein